LPPKQHIHRFTDKSKAKKTADYNNDQQSELDKPWLVFFAFAGTVWNDN